MKGSGYEMDVREDEEALRHSGDEGEPGAGDYDGEQTASEGSTTRLQLLDDDREHPGGRHSDHEGDMENGHGSHVGNGHSSSSSSSNTMTLDEAIEKVGFGAFQYRLLVICGISWMADAIEMTLLSYLIQNAQEEFELTNFWGSFLGSVVFVGMWIGALLFGVLSDKKGRRIGYFASTTLTFIFSIASSFAPTFWLLVLLRGIVGIGLGGITIPFTLFTEFLPQEKRGLYLILMNIFWTIGTVFSAGIAWAIIPTYGWRWYVFAATLPVLIPLSLFKVTPESPRYYAVSGQPQKMRQVLVNAAALNGRVFPKDCEIIGTVTIENRGSLKDLFSRALLKTTLLLWALWFINTCSYYGVVILTPSYFHVENSTGSEYLDVFVTCLAEFPGIFASALLINTRGRKQTLAIMLGVFALFSSFLLIPSPKGLGTFFACISRGAMLGAYATVYVYTPEAYPTDLRTTSLGSCSAVSRVGGMLAPFIARAFTGSAEDPNLTFPIVFFAVICFIGSIFSMMLPLETRGRSLDHKRAADGTKLLGAD